MKTLEQIRKTLAQHRQELRERFKVEEIGVFGSYVKKQQRSNSDVDVLVTFSETVDLFTFVELENYLRELLGVKVDLVMKDALKPRLRERILNEAVYL
jgi:predicted nucleotidyltransferase